MTEKLTRRSCQLKRIPVCSLSILVEDIKLFDYRIHYLLMHIKSTICCHISFRAGKEKVTKALAFVRRIYVNNRMAGIREACPAYSDFRKQ